MIYLVKTDQAARYDMTVTKMKKFIGVPVKLVLIVLTVANRIKDV